MENAGLSKGEHPLDKLLHEFGRRRWHRDFGVDDVESMLHCTDEEASQAVFRGLSSGFFDRHQAKYRLTRKGEKHIQSLRVGRPGDETLSSRPTLRDFARKISRLSAPEPADDLSENLSDEEFQRELFRIAAERELSENADAGGFSENFDPDVGFSENTDAGGFSENCTADTGFSRLSEKPEADGDSEDSESCQPEGFNEIFECGLDSENAQPAELPSVSFLGFSEMDAKQSSYTPEGSMRSTLKQTLELEDLDIDLNNKYILSRARARSNRDAKVHWRTKNFEDKRRQARELMAGKSPHVQHPDHARVTAFANAHQSFFRIYTGQPHLKLVKDHHLNSENKFYKLYAKAAKIAESIGAPYLEFVKAQYYGFEVLFARPPNVWELCGKNAVKRWEQYQAALASGRTRAETNIVRRAKKAVVSQSARWSRCDSVLRSLMRNYRATEEQVLRVFAIKADGSVFFDSDWLNANPTYQRLKKAEGN